MSVIVNLYTANMWGQWCITIYLFVMLGQPLYQLIYSDKNK